MQPDNQLLQSLVEVPSPTNGFSMAGLADLAKQYGLNLVAVRRTAGQDLIVPSVVHWRQNHYAAILQKQDDGYLVSDPTFGSEKVLPAEVINEEASGEFLIPAAKETNGWTQLASNDAKTIHGMGLPNNVDDGKDKCCVTLFNGQVSCAQCSGMPIWWVSEPYVNLWMADQPISYKTSRGQPFTFQVTYKQRDTRPASSDYLVSTAGWNNSWASYIRLDSVSPCFNTHGTGCLPSLSSSYASVYLPNGGEADFNPGQSFDQATRLTLLQQNPELPLKNGYDYGDNGLRLVHADGSQDIYGLSLTIPVPYGDDSEAEFMLTRHIDPNGDTTWFQYDSYGGAYLLTFVVDPDGHTNTLTYNTTSSLLLSVTNAYGQSAHFKYDGSGNLTNIVDAQGLFATTANGIEFEPAERLMVSKLRL
jgi:YD repeat-containing protein